MGFDSVADGDKSGSTTGRTILVLATFTLLAGTSMASGLEDFASQEYAEEDWREGVVDDATDDDGWDTMKSEDKPMKRAAKKFIRAMMGKRMDDRMDDRTDHLEDRMTAGQELVTAFQFCIEHTECTGDAGELRFMIDSINSRHADMREKIDVKGSEELPEQRDRMMADDDDSQEDCEASGGTWSEERQVCYSEDERDDREDEEETRFDCRTEEVWSEEKKEWCDALMVKDEGWYEWDGVDRKASMLESAAAAVAFCLESEDCTADEAALTVIHDRMIDRHQRHVRDAARLDRGGWDDGESRVMADIQVSQETCLERGGEWVTDVENSACVWPEFDREGCDKGEDREDQSEDDREEDREDESDESATTQADCEANGGTWSEERQACY